MKKGTIRIRPAEQRDLSDLAALCGAHARYERSSIEPIGHLRRKLGRALFGRTPLGIAWVAVDGDAVVGYATASAVFSTWRACCYLHMDCLYLAPRARGRGAGRAILDAIVNYARKHRYGWLEWQTPIWNSSAVGFYGRMGARNKRKQRFTLRVKSPSS